MKEFAVTSECALAHSSTDSAASKHINRPRHTTPEAGRALEILGHAIEYLADELVHEGGPLSAANGQVQAIQLLMALNRRIYFECPIASTIGDRLHLLLDFVFLRKHQLADR